MRQTNVSEIQIPTQTAPVISDFKLVTDYITYSEKEPVFENYDYFKFYIYLNDLTSTQKGDKYYTSYQSILQLSDSNGRLVYETSSLSENKYDSKTTTGSIYLSSRFGILTPGEYQLKIIVRDSYSKKESFIVQKLTVISSEFDMSEPVITDVNRGSFDDYHMVPIFNQGKSFDLYIMGSKIGSANIITDIKLTDLSNNEIIFDNKNFATDKLDDASLFKKRITVDTSTYNKGKYRFDVTLTDNISKTTNTKSVVFELR